MKTKCLKLVLLVATAHPACGGLKPRGNKPSPSIAAYEPPTLENIEQGAQDSLSAGQKKIEDTESRIEQADVGNDSVKTEISLIGRDFSQYNQTLSRVTGVSTSETSDIYESIKSTLPASNSYNEFTPFAQISMVNLSQAYCDLWVDRKPELREELDSQQFTELLMTSFFITSGKSIILATNEEIFNYTDLVPRNDIQKLYKTACSTVLASAFFTVY